MPIHKNDIGTVFQFVLTRDGATFDVSTASVKQVRFRDSDDYVVTRAAEFTTNGADGKLQYTTLDGDLDCVGTLRLQAYVVLPSGAWSSDIIDVEIAENLT